MLHAARDHVFAHVEDEDVPAPTRIVEDVPAQRGPVAAPTS